MIVDDGKPVALERGFGACFRFLFFLLPFLFLLPFCFCFFKKELLPPQKGFSDEKCAWLQFSSNKQTRKLSLSKSPFFFFLLASLKISFFRFYKSMLSLHTSQTLKTTPKEKRWEGFLPAIEKKREKNYGKKRKKERKKAKTLLFFFASWNVYVHTCKDNLPKKEA